MSNKIPGKKQNKTKNNKIEKQKTYLILTVCALVLVATIILYFYIDQLIRSGGSNNPIGTPQLLYTNTQYYLVNEQIQGCTSDRLSFDSGTSEIGIAVNKDECVKDGFLYLNLVDEPDDGVPRPIKYATQDVIIHGQNGNGPYFLGAGLQNRLTDPESTPMVNEPDYGNISSFKIFDISGNTNDQTGTYVRRNFPFFFSNAGVNSGTLALVPCIDSGCGKVEGPENTYVDANNLNIYALSFYPISIPNQLITAFKAYLASEI
jgi:hypothetical protein